jgi:hypothetical protein
MTEFVILSHFNSERVQPGTAVISKDTNVGITRLVNFPRNTLIYFRCNCPCTFRVPISHKLNGAITIMNILIRMLLKATLKK